MGINVALEQLATDLVDAAYTVHRQLGPGLLESVYQACLVYELKKRGHAVREQAMLPVYYDGLYLEIGFRPDIILSERIIIENKVALSIHPVHIAQLLTYLRLSGLKLGFLINWNSPRLKDGIRRVVNRLEE
ncbi:MAG: GxxExxY protein [Gemmatimonadota bacterium]